MTTLRIAMLAPPWIPVPPPCYGGIEHVVALLSDALVRRGHAVRLFAAPGSRSTAEVHEVLDRPHHEQIERALYEADHVARALEEIDRGPFDVVHDHCGFTGLAFADRVGVPLVHTLHGPFDDDTTPFYAEHGHKACLVAISEAQAAMTPAGVEICGVVPNPIDVGAFTPRDGDDGYLLWMNRFAPVKGADRAIDVARRANRPLILAGPVQAGQEEHFAADVEPHLDDDRVRYAGEVGGEERERLLAGAAALLMPIRWAEPFGMAMVEAMACGTPVLAYPEGAAPEVVEDGVSGFLCDDEDAMVAAVGRLGELDAAACRRSAERFRGDVVAAGYERAYARAMGVASAPAAGRD